MLMKTENNSEGSGAMTAIKSSQVEAKNDETSFRFVYLAILILFSGSYASSPVRFLCILLVDGYIHVHI